VEIAKIHWTASCVQPVKLPPLPNAAHANVVHQAVLANQEETAKMVTPEPMEKQEAQAKMPDQTTTSSQCHLNATVTLHQAAQANQDQKDPMEAQAMLEHQAVMDNQEPKDHQAHKAQLAKPETMDPKDQAENQEHKKKAAQAQQAHWANPVHQELQDQQVQPEVQAKTVVPVPQEPQEMLEAQEMQEKPVPPVVQETMVNQVPLVLAPTAHLLVWLQVINPTIDNNNISAISSISHSSITFLETNFVSTSYFLF